MNPWKSCYCMLVASSCLAFGLACEAQIDETEAVVEDAEAEAHEELDAEIVQCEQNTIGIRGMARSALNAALDPLADHVDSMDWGEFCGCFARELRKDSEAYPKGDKEWSYAEFEQRRDAIAVRCAARGLEAATDEGPELASHPAGGLAANDAKFAPIVDHCEKSPEGYLTPVRIHLEAQRSPRAAKAMGMEPNAYCTCYVNRMRRALGDEVAHQFLGSIRMTSELDFIAIGRATDDAYDACAAEQIPFG